jgi:CDP-paratose 2-epimerase
MKVKKILITGSSGLIGSSCVEYYCKKNFSVVGIDNNMRAIFFGNDGSTNISKENLQRKYSNYTHYETDIRIKEEIFKIFEEFTPDAIIHCAAQPSHDLAAKIPFDDFTVNANATLNLLEATRIFCKNSPFIFLSTNKVYGDKPNYLNLEEKEFRWDFKDKEYQGGINENLGVDQTKHSLFGCSKLSADVIVQEYGRYFDMNTVCLRGGCLTGSNHSGVEYHGFLSYLVKCFVYNKNYSVFGFKGKQVRDNIDSGDVANFTEYFINSPRSAEVYNIGGGKENSISILETINYLEEKYKKKMHWNYVDESRIGDHICYYSDLTKIKEHYPKWRVNQSLDVIIDNIYESWSKKKIEQI